MMERRRTIHVYGVDYSSDEHEHSGNKCCPTPRISFKRVGLACTGNVRASIAESRTG